MSLKYSAVSVIIPTFNRRDFLARALDSVFSQSLLPFEVIVVDNNSTDGTAEMVQQVYPEVRYFHHAKQGVSAARNRGIAEARGEWIALLDSDDVWLPQKLERQMKALLQQPDAVICHSEEQWVRNGERVNVPAKYQKASGWIFEKSLRHCGISPSTVILRKQLFEMVGGFDESLPVCEDYDMWLRITARFPILLVEQPLIEKHGGHDDQLSTAHWGMDRFRIQSLNQFIQFGVLSWEQREAAIDAIQAMCRIVQAGARKHQNPRVEQEMESLLALY